MAQMRGREAALLVALIGWQALAAWLSWRNYARLPEVLAGADEDDAPLAPDRDSAGLGSRYRSPEPIALGDTQPGVGAWEALNSKEPARPLPISVIVPARDEAGRLPALLASLAAQRHPATELIVVDDESRDGTAELARAAGARMLATGGPPDGWTGKNYACHLGADAASGQWLLFLDADTTMGPVALAAALGYAQRWGIDGLSLFLQQRCESFWERLLLPYAYAHYFAGARPGAPIANGQFILIAAEAYRRCGGHAAVRGSAIDDVALARRCADTGVRLRMARGESLAAVRMYDGLPAIWNGFGKNSFRFVAADPLGGALTVGSSVAATAIFRLAWRALRLGGGARALAALASYLIAVQGLRPWARLFRAGRLSAPLSPLASVVFMAIACNSMLRVVMRRGVRWKGRTLR